MNIVLFIYVQHVPPPFELMQEYPARNLSSIDPSITLQSLEVHKANIIVRVPHGLLTSIHPSFLHSLLCTDLIFPSLLHLTFAHECITDQL